MMTTFALIHGAGDVGWYWHLVERELRAKGHDVVAPDLPVDEGSASFDDYATTVVSALGDRTDDVIVVGMSFGGYTAPIVAERVGARHLVLVAPMVPLPGESPGGMFEATGYEQEPQEDPSDLAVFYHDVPEDLGREALSRGRAQAGGTWEEPWPLAAWPKVPVTAIIGRHDRLFSASWLRTVIQDRLGVTPVDLESGHCIALSRPAELAGILDEVARSAHAVP